MTADEQLNQVYGYVTRARRNLAEADWVLNQAIDAGHNFRGMRTRILRLRNELDAELSILETRLEK